MQAMKQSRSLFSSYAVSLQSRNAHMILLGREVCCATLYGPPNVQTFLIGYTRLGLEIAWSLKKRLGRFVQLVEAITHSVSPLRLRMRLRLRLPVLIMRVARYPAYRDFNLSGRSDCIPDLSDTLPYSICDGDCAAHLHLRWS